jgi:membrane protease YdiL (CAAX protease family)
MKMTIEAQRRPSSRSALIRLWQRIPVLIQAVVVGLLVSTIGALGWPLIASLVPAPWSIILMGGLLWLYWKYFSGSWWPRSTAEARRNRFRAVRRPAAVWKWSMVAALLFVVAAQSAFVVTFRLIEYPADRFIEEYAFDSLPLWLAWVAILTSSAVAGICEETGFRGYMQVPLEKRYGVGAAIGITSLIFLLVHLEQAWAAPLLLHLFVLGSLLGILAYASGSLIPSMIGHAVMDIFNFSYWWSDVAGRWGMRTISETGIDSHFILWSLAFGLSLALFFWTARRTMIARQRTMVSEADSK